MKHNTLKLTSIMRDTLVDVYGQNKKMKVNAAGKKERVWRFEESLQDIGREF